MPVEYTSAPVPAAEKIRGRKFGVYDSMMSIAGIALMLAYVKHNAIILLEQLMGLWNAIAAYLGVISPMPYRTRQFLMKSMEIYWSTALWYGVQAAEQMILIMTPVFLFMRVRWPRPSIRALLRQPGTVAGLAVTFGFIWVNGWMHRLFFGRINDGTAAAVAVGGTVLLAWTCLLLGRKWEAERSWLDRIGRILGATAIAVGTIALSVFGI